MIDTIAVSGKLYSGDDSEPVEPMLGEEGIGEVEITDENEIAVHFRHVNDTSALLSLYLNRANALAFAEVLRSAAAKPYGES